jgi:hypothetical protein
MGRVSRLGRAIQSFGSKLAHPRYLSLPSLNKNVRDLGSFGAKKKEGLFPNFSPIAKPSIHKIYVGGPEEKKGNFPNSLGQKLLHTQNVRRREEVKNVLDAPISIQDNWPHPRSLCACDLPAKPATAIGPVSGHGQRLQ